MKNRILSFVIGIFALGCLSASAQTVSAQQDFESGFTGINVGDMFSVTVRGADYYGVDWNVDSAIKNYVHVYKRGTELVITVDRKSFDSATKKLYSGKKAKNAVIKAVVYAPKLSSVVASEDAKVDVSNIDIQVESFNLDITDNAVVRGLAVNSPAVTLSAAKKAVLEESFIDAGNLSVNALNSAVMTVDQTSKNLSLQVNASSTVNVSGNCESIDVVSQNSAKLNIKGEALSINLGAGCKEIHAEELKVSDVKVVGSNNCKVYVYPEETLSLDLKGGCHVLYAGKPEIDIVNIQNSSVGHLNL